MEKGKMKSALDKSDYCSSQTEQASKKGRQGKEVLKDLAEFYQQQ
jgi:hypothetical protein